MAQLVPPPPANTPTHSDLLVKYYNYNRKRKLEIQKQLEQRSAERLVLLNRKAHCPRYTTAWRALDAAIDVLDELIATLHADTLSIDEFEALIRKQWNEVKKKDWAVREEYLKDLLNKLQAHDQKKQRYMKEVAESKVRKVVPTEQFEGSVQ